MDTKELPMAKRMLEERISLAVNKLRNEFKEQTGIDVISVNVNFSEVVTNEGGLIILLDGVECKLAL